MSPVPASPFLPHGPEGFPVPEKVHAEVEGGKGDVCWDKYVQTKTGEGVRGRGRNMQALLSKKLNNKKKY